MDAHANQRKRGGRLAKNGNGNDCISPPQSTEQNEVMDVSAVAISPTLEEVETTTNAPMSECRRSSRKKIIKFDVRDLLNKNRKTHKIQIEARIDSNAPTTSKAATAGGNESANPKSSTAREDLLSKQKTFLEKSAIFRRYSVSQDHKPPPPPLPMPPLLSKGNDNKDARHSGNGNSRRLSRTQEFFSNVMIKPKQTTSLIVAQIQSNTPCTSATAKRKSMNKSLELETKAMPSSETECFTVVQQRKRGRPAKLRTQTSMELVAATSVPEKKITPEKARNWKEYKACLAQQSGTKKEEPENMKSLQQEKHASALPKSKQDEITKLESLMNLEETQQSDISKSEDDDGNFSGFKTSRDDLSCDSPVLEKISLTKAINFKGTLNKADVKVGAGIKDATTKMCGEFKEKQTTLKTKIADSKQMEKSRKKIEQFIAEQKQAEEITCIKGTEMATPSTVQIESKSKQTKKELVRLSLQKEFGIKNYEITTKTETKEPSNKKIEKITSITVNTVIRDEIKKNKALDVKQTKTICTTVKTVLQDDKDNKEITPLKRNTRRSPEIFDKKNTEAKSEGITKRSQPKIEENMEVKTLDKEQTTSPEADALDNRNHNVITDLDDDTKRQATSSADLKETEIVYNINSEQLIQDISRQLRKEEIKDIKVMSSELQDDKTKPTAAKIEKNVEKILLETYKHSEESTTITCLKTPTTSQTVEVEELKTPNILFNAAQQIVEECTPETKLLSADILLLTSEMSSVSQPSTPSKETMKSFSRTSSSSESENASERSSYSYDPSSTSSSSGRSYKSGDKLRVSLKRISLPKSPSTSSQTSTSEELNSSQNSDVFKKKPPMGKRSKRLKNKFLEMLESKDNSENINDCFQSIKSEQNSEIVTTKHSDKEGIKAHEQVSIEQITLSIEENKADVCANILKVDIEEDKSTEIVTHSLLNLEALEQTSENINSVSTGSTNIEKELVKETIVKRKSLRNRKDNSSEDKDDEIEKRNSNQGKEMLNENVEEVQEHLFIKIQDVKQKETISTELEKDKQEENLETIPKEAHELQKIPESDQSDKSDENKQKRKTRNNDPPTKQQPQRKHKKQTSPKLGPRANKADEIRLEAENVIDNLEGAVNLEASVQELKKLITESNESCHSSSSTEMLDKQEKSHKILIIRNKTNKEEIPEKELNIQAEDTRLKDSSSKQKPNQKHESISDVIETVISEISTDKNKSTKETLRKTDKEKSITTTATRSKTNNEEISEKESNIEAENPVAIERKESKLNEIATQSTPKKKFGQKNELNFDVHSIKCSADKSKPFEEMLITSDTETCAGKPEKSSKLTTRSKTYKEEICVKEPKIGKATQEEDIAISELMPETFADTEKERSKSYKEKSTKTNDGNKILSIRCKSNEELKIEEDDRIEVSTLDENKAKTLSKSELMPEKPPEIVTTRSTSPKDKSTKTKEKSFAYIQENSTKILSTRSKTNKEEISTKSKIEGEKTTQEEFKPRKCSGTARDKSESPKESTIKTDEETKILSTRSKSKKEEMSTKQIEIQEENLIEKPTQHEGSTKGVLKSDLMQETTRDRSKYPKEMSSSKQDMSTKETKIEVKRPTQDELMQEKSSETIRSKSPKEKFIRKIDEETKTFATRSKTITKESKMYAENLIEKTTPDKGKANFVSKTEIMEENLSEPAIERSKSSKEMLTTTSEENSKKISSPRIRNNKKDNSTIETNIVEEKSTDKLTTTSLEDKDQKNNKKSMNKFITVANKSTPREKTTGGSDSAEITGDKEVSDDKHVETDKITSTRSKINEKETFPNTPTRSRSKKAIVLVDEDAESLKTAESTITTLCTPITSTTLIADVQADSSKSSLEHALLEGTKVTATKDPNTFTKVISDLRAKSSKFFQNAKVETREIVTRASSKSPPCSKVTHDIDSPSSAKRKSLKNEKDINSPDDTTDSTSNTLKLLEESSPANLLQEQTLPTEEQQVEEILKTIKRRGRKSRFKNLHSSEVENETDSSNGKNTPIEEIMQRKQKDFTSFSEQEKQKEFPKICQTTEVQTDLSEQIKETDQGLELKANPDGNQVTPDVGIVKDTSANIFSSQIQNVSIETNTLLDILRQVQSNTEAALKASKPPTTISKTESDNTSESGNKMDIEERVKNPQESNINEFTTKTNIQECEKKSQDLLKISQESKSSSPTRSDTESPLTLKKMHLSPARSDTSSPLTLKKVIQSPTRSDSSSPLTLKKGTRRYERRSHRGEDPVHKTLEETFAEIAAQSSKAVLAAKEFDFNEKQTENENSQVEINDINTVTNIKNEKIVEIFTKIDNPSNDLQEVQLNVEEKVDTLEENLPNILQLSEDMEKVSNVIEQVEIEIKTSENVVELKETTKIITTPAKRGRKPKNRSLEELVAKEDVEVKYPTKAQVEMKEVNQEKLIEAAVQEKTGETTSEVIIQKSELKQEHKISKSKKSKANASLTAADTAQSEELLESLDNSSPALETKVQSTATSDVLQTHMEYSVKTIDDTNETKAIKKSTKKRDASKGPAETVTEDTTLLDANTCKEDEVRTPKQAAKRRDTSQTKSETKSVGKKLPKKTKHEEDGGDTVTKTTPSVITTTPPPYKRGRKPKNQQQETPQTTTCSKKKNKNETTTDHIEDCNEEKRKALDSETESLNSSLDKSLDEKMAKKKRQKKLKEAFEAALTDDMAKAKEALKTDTSSFSTSSDFGLTLLNISPPPHAERRLSKDTADDSVKITCITPVEAEEDPDPLRDIEKFIADGVNLLKKDYKLDEDSVDDVIASATPSKTYEILEEPEKCSNEETLIPVFNTFETPADTPLNTPSVTPPPKSPTSIESTTPDEHSGVRRSHRIKLITKTPKALVGRGLVKDKERFSIKDDVETKSHYTLDDHLTGLAEVEAKNAKFLKEMEERLSNFQVIKENEYWCERVISREARKMICDCFLTHEEEERGELGCGEDCLNRLLMIECGTECNVKERCTNNCFQKLLCSPCRVFRTEKKGFGIMADIEILPGEFIMEYVGEVIDTDEFEKRRILYSQDKNRHYYFMALRSDAIIDATIKGNISRFINHSCDPNAETQKWTVNGELRIGFFSRKSIMPGEEITFNYQYQRYGREAQRCYCESANCTGWIGQEPTSDEGEQLDDDDEYEESEDEEEADTSNLLVQDDDEDSDASVADPEEVQKQLEMAAAQAEVELAPLQLLEENAKQEESSPKEGEPTIDPNKSESEEDSKSKFKKLLSKMAEKVAAKQKQTKREQKLQRKKKSKESSSDLTNKLRFLEDPDIEDEVEFLKECGLKNQYDTLRLSRLMVRAKLVQTRLNLLQILRQGDLPCRRLFLDYHGLRLVHGWMSEDAGNMQIRLALLQTLETLPIANKTVLTDSKVLQMVRNWCGHNTNLSPSEDSSSSNSNSQDVPVQAATNFEEGSDLAELQKLALKLITTWEGLPEIFRIPKKERIEQMKEHEREADRQYAANAETQENVAATDRYHRDRFGRGFSTFSTAAPSSSNRFVKPNNGNHLRPSNTTPKNNKNLSKAQRREMFAAKVARDEAEKRLAEERREFETKCRFFGLDPKKTRLQDIPFCVNPATGQWFSIERKPITTPPSYAHVQVPVKPKSTDPNDYQLPAVCSSLPPQWKYAITPQGKIYYYHVKHRIPQWEPPSAAQLHQCDIEDREDDSESELTTTAGEDSSDDDDEILIGMDAAQLKAYIDRKVEMRRQKRYLRLVDERCISPRREEDRIYNQIEVRKYKENKEKIRKRKEEIRRKRAEALRQTSINMCTLGSITDANTNPGTNRLPTESNDEEIGVLPIQDYLLSSDEEVDLKAEVNSPLIDKIVEGDKIVDELDALTIKRQLKRPLPPHRDLNEPSTSSSPPTTSALSALIARQEYKKRKLEKKEKRKPKEQDAKYRKNKEKFRCEIAGIIVHHLKPYRKETCTVGRIESNEDFNHLARKLTHFVMIKELKYCESVGQTLVVTESVKSKSREFIKKYMTKYGDVYVKPSNDPDFKDIPFKL